LQVRVLPGPPAFVGLCGHVENDSISLLERLDFVSETIRFQISLTPLTNFASIFLPIFAVEKSEGGPFPSNRLSAAINA
jgi:hypothetical protein